MSGPARIALALLVLAAGYGPADAGKIYWSEPGSIRRADKDGSNVETVVPNLFANGLAVGGGKLYWVDAGRFEIRRADLDGQGLEILVDPVNARGVELDLPEGKIYWAEGAFYETIRRANLDGTEVEDVIVDLPQVDGVNAIAIDSANQWIYFSNGLVFRSHTGGGTVVELHVAGGSAYGMALDVPNDAIYVANDEFCLVEARLGGTDWECFDSGSIEQTAAFDLALDSGSRELYWSLFHVDGGIWRKGLDSGTKENVLPGLPARAWVAVDAGCGDGTVDPGESCDDGNSDAGDGCENDCSETPVVVPALSGRGLIVAMLLALAASTVAYRRGR